VDAARVRIHPIGVVTFEFIFKFYGSSRKSVQMKSFDKALPAFSKTK
jgi:hypothetical protein